METKAEYLISTSTPVRRKDHQCPSCHVDLGREIRGGEYLLSGNLLIMKVWAICAKCGFPIDWNNSDRHIRHITERMKARAR